MRQLFKRLLPGSFLQQLRPLYHGAQALLAHYRFGRPSHQLTVIGVTGTAGKSTTVNLIAHLLRAAGHRVGFVTTVNYSLGDDVLRNPGVLSMPSGPELHLRLRQMLDQHCKYAIIECSSEGLAQNRHWGIRFIGAVLTNLSPAHLAAHGGWANYVAAKLRLFAAQSKSQVNNWVVINIDAPESFRFAEASGGQKHFVSEHGVTYPNGQNHSLVVQAISPVKFLYDGHDYLTGLLGHFNGWNASLAVQAALCLGVSASTIQTSLPKFAEIAGRMEFVPNQHGIKVIVDYAPEPAGLAAALAATRELTTGRLIHVFGSAGGHRDEQKRYEFGDLSARFADHIIITNDDVYDTDPQHIARQIRSGIDRVHADQRRVTEVEVILDRDAAIHSAINQAKSGDTILITGKGSENFLILPGNKKIPWDDRDLAKHILDSKPKL